MPGGPAAYIGLREMARRRQRIQMHAAAETPDPKIVELASARVGDFFDD